MTFDAPQKAAALLVYESYNPGAFDRVTVYAADGREAEVWSGADPTQPTEQSGVSAISIKAPFDVARAKLHLNSPAVSGSMRLTRWDWWTRWAKRIGQQAQPPAARTPIWADCRL